MFEMNHLAEWLRTAVDLAKAHVSSIVGGLFAVAAAVRRVDRAAARFFARRPSSAPRPSHPGLEPVGRFR